MTEYPNNYYVGNSLPDLPTNASATGATGIAIDISGSVWTSNGPANTITRILGAAAPTISPIASAIGNNTQGTRP